MPTVNPKILTWARETAGFSLEDAADAIGLKSAHGKSGADRLAELETGQKELSRPLLLRMSDKYRRSLLVFYLNEPPSKGDRGEDFRTLPGSQSPTFNAYVDALIRNLKARQSLVKSLLEDEELEPLDFVDSIDMSNNTQDVADEIMSILDFDLNKFRTERNVSEAFNYLRQRMERRGIFVLLIGDLGSHHTALPVQVFRGFAIADPIAPFIIINDHDAKSAWSFTLLHEMTHLLLGTTGISGTSFEVHIERFCNEVAGLILLPTHELNALAAIETMPFDEAVDLISEFAETRNLSRAMVTYKLFQSNRIEEMRWRELTGRFTQDRLEMSGNKPEKESGSKGGPNYYTVRRHRLGQALLGLVSRSLNDGSLSPTKAGRILGVKPRNVEPLLSSKPFQGGL